MNSSNDNDVKRSGHRIHVPKLSKFLVIVVIGCFMISFINVSIVRMKPERQNPFDMLWNSISFAADRNGIGHYVPSPMERYLIDTANVSFTGNTNTTMSSGCLLWNDISSNNALHETTQTYLKELEVFADLNSKVSVNFKDIRDEIFSSDGNVIRNQAEVCRSLRVSHDGLPGIFKSGELSKMSTGEYVEPLYPPLRHPKFCTEGNKYTLNLSFIVHDFEYMCQQLKPRSRTILLDMGASLDFHAGDTMPAVYLMKEYKRFGFKFDHIYAFEITQAEPKHVFEKVPDEFFPAYHWINVGVSPDSTSKLNPLVSILKTFNEDDLIVVKLDVDTCSVELPLVNQILKDKSLSNLIDQFYFEYHIYMKEIYPSFKRGLGRDERSGGCKKSSVKDSLDLFHNLRKNGVTSHFWV